MVLSWPLLTFNVYLSVKIHAYCCCIAHSIMHSSLNADTEVSVLMLKELAWRMVQIGVMVQG